MRNSCIYANKPVTFRRSSTKILEVPSFKGYGGNLQNIEKSMREIYIPDGFRDELKERCIHWLKTGDLSVFTDEELDKLRAFSQADQGGAEALMVAYECEAKDYRKLFIHQISPHVYVAMHLFEDIWTKKMKERGGLIEDFSIQELKNTPIEKLKENPFWFDLSKLIKSSDDWNITERYYYLAKQTVHSSNYEIQAPNFRMNVLEKSGGKIFISKADAERFLLTYRGLFPEIPERNRRIRSIVESDKDNFKYLYNIFGFPFCITEYEPGESTIKEYYAWSAQSSVGEITRIAFTDLYYFIQENKEKWDILSDCHDSYMIQHPLQDTAGVHSAMSSFLNQKLISPFDGTVFHMRSEVKTGFNWSPSSKENPDGLQTLEWI
jgi:hypothetical protein